MQVLHCGQCQRQQEASGLQWLRVLPADALRKAGSLQKAHQPSLESLLSAQASGGIRICPPEKVLPFPILPSLASVQRSMCCALRATSPGLIPKLPILCHTTHEV